jgi:hypothetical protein
MACVNDYVSNKPKALSFFASYPIGYLLNIYVILSPPYEATQAMDSGATIFQDGRI